MPEPAPAAPREWNAATYHRVSGPQFGWGQAVLDRLTLAGDETVVDAGCGTARLTTLLVERLPRGRAVGVDPSANMLATARATAPAGLRARLRFVQASIDALPFTGVADAIFSTATFHWVLDHPRLFRSLFQTLKPGGRLVAQCGGGANLARVHAHAHDVVRGAAYAPYFAGFTDPKEFADAETTRARLEAAGFTEVVTRLTASPIVQPDRAAFVEFTGNVILRPFLSRLPDDGSRQAFLEGVADRAAADPIPYELDYWRLDIDAVRPR